MESPKLTSWFTKEVVSRVTDTSSWVLKHRTPFGVDRQLGLLRSWLRDYMERRPGTPKGVLLTGPPGTGKTLCAVSVLASHGLNVVERNASSVRTKKAMEDDIVHTVEMGYPNALLIEDVDSIVSGQGGLETILKLVNPLRQSNKPITIKDRERVQSIWTVPIVCVANTINSRPISDLASDCLHITFEAHAPDTLLQIAECVRRTEPGALGPGPALDRVIQNSMGDARQFVLSLEYSAKTAGGELSAKDKDHTVLELAAMCFEGSKMTVGEIDKACSSDPLSTSHAVQENFLKREGIGLSDALTLAQYASDADLICTDEDWSRVNYWPCLTFAPAHILLCPSKGEPVAPGVIWSKSSYRAARFKQIVKARDSFYFGASKDTVYAFASIVKALATRGDYRSVAELCVQYSLDYQSLEQTLKVLFKNDSLKQRHKTALKKLLPS